MADLVHAKAIEAKVGARRQDDVHLGRMDTADATVYVLHSRVCVDVGRDLRECSYSRALDAGIDRWKWADWEDLAVVLEVYDGELVPVRSAPPSARIAV